MSSPSIAPRKAALAGAILKTWLNSRLLIGLGTISYSVYMCHEAIIWTSSQIFRLLLKRPEHIVNGQTAPLTGVVEAMIASAIVIFCVIAASVLVYRKIEKPFRERSRELILPPSALARA